MAVCALSINKFQFGIARSKKQYMSEGVPSKVVTFVINLSSPVQYHEQPRILISLYLFRENSNSTDLTQSYGAS